VSIDQYQTWINANVGKNNGYGECDHVCKKMIEAFPELRLRKGFFHSGFWGERGHWWLLSACGLIVDPTGKQFPDGLSFPSEEFVKEYYEDLTDVSEDELADRVSTGPCYQCGDPCFHGDMTCSERCTQKTHAEFNSC